MKMKKFIAVLSVATMAADLQLDVEVQIVVLLMIRAAKVTGILPMI